MIQYTLNLLDTIKKDIQIIDLEDDTTLNKSVKIIELLKTYFNELKEHISEYTFNNETEEIQFFKKTKPQIFCMLIYYDNIYRLEINRPTGSELMQKAFTLKQFDDLKEYFDNNIDFYKYCRSQRTDLDKQYFLRYQPDVEMYFDCHYFERDRKFSTGFDLKVATILANDMLSNYLNAELVKEDLPNNHQFDNSNIQKVKAKWTGSKVALVELIYAFNTSKCINNGKSDLKRMTSYVENLFDIDLGDVYRTFIEIRNRKGNRVQCLDDLRNKLIARMDEVDND
ncbi:MAG: RteC domain-containing protein [Bacteroidales bacterium]